MREDIKKVLCDLEERAMKDIQKLLEAKADFSTTEWQAAGQAVDIIKDVECAIKDAITTMAMNDEYGEEWEDYGDSKRGRMTDYYPMGDVSLGGRRNVRTNKHMGGSSYAGEMDNAIANLHNLMNNAGSESERMMYKRFIDEAERERYRR